MFEPIHDKLILLGVHGTGKTTALAKLYSLGYRVFPEIIRDLIKSLGRDNQEDLQHRLLHEKYDQLMKFLAEDRKIAMDRTTLDVILYSKQFGTPLKQEESIDYILDQPYFSDNKDKIQFFYFPLTAFNQDWIKEDPIRESWEKDPDYIGEFRKRLDEQYQILVNKMLKNGFCVDYWDYKN